MFACLRFVLVCFCVMCAQVCLCGLFVIYRAELCDLLFLCVFNVIVWNVFVRWCVMVSGVCAFVCFLVRCLCGLFCCV